MSPEHSEQGPDGHEAEPERHMPKVWIAALGAYNDGQLHGRWVDAGRNVDEVWQDVRDILATSPVADEQEFGIFDHEGFYGLDIHEYEPLDRVATIATGIRLHGEGFAHWLAYAGTDDLESAEEAFEQAYVGEFEDDDELKRHLEQEAGVEAALKTVERKLGWLALYVTFDADSYYEHLQVNGDLHVSYGATGKVFAFRCR